MNDLTGWLSAIGDAQAQACTAIQVTPEAWLRHAADRAEWLLWGKAQPDAQCPAHPLLCHMLDVAAVAARLLTTLLPTALRRRLLAITPDDVDALRTLLFVIALHDIGKATPAFQVKVDWARTALPRLGFDLQADRNARFHGDIGLFLLKPTLEAYGMPSPHALRLARAVTAHHGQFPTNREGLKQAGSRERGKQPQWDRARKGIVRSVADLFGVVSLSGTKEIDHPYAVLLAGLTSVADWVGSMQGFFPYEPPQVTPATYWPLALERADRALESAGFRATPSLPAKSFGELFPDRDPWPLQTTAERVAATLDEPSLIVLEAPMGEGKTEGALLLANASATHTGEAGFYIGLPTQATANQMFDRVARFLNRTRKGTPSTLLLAHAEAALVDRFRRVTIAAVSDKDGDDAGSVRAEEWFLSKKRALLGEFAVGTIDQALLGVMRVPHAFVRLYGLGGKAVIFDEIHAYDTYTSNLLDRLVEWLAAIRTTVVLLSATLPAKRRADLIRAYRKGAGLPDGEQPKGSYPRITLVSSERTEVRSFAPRAAPVTVRVQRVPDELDEVARDVMEEARQGRCVGWICNTVARAQAATVRVREQAADIRRLLLHSRLFPEERAKREAQVERWLGPEREGAERPPGCIVIGTQVLEQSLDIDFDFLVTDVAPMDLLLQRAGRLWRHARSNRAPRQEGPRLAIVCPDGSWKTASLERVAVVYPEFLVRRTLEKLDGLDTLTLPTDIEPLIEAVYADDAIPADDELYGTFIDHHGGQAVQRNLAEQKLMPHPFTSDDPFGDLRVFLKEDEDPVLHQQLRADTRLGPPSVELVCVEERGKQLFVGDGEAIPLDLSQEPERPLVERLVLRSIGVSHQRVFHAITRDVAAAPKSWQRSPLLRYRRLLAFTDGRAEVAGMSLVLDLELGLCIQQPGRSA